VAGLGGAVRVEDTQRAFFDAYGFIVLRGLFVDDIDEIAAAFDEVFADPAVPRLPLTLAGNRGHPRHAMGEFVEKHPRLGRLVTDERLTGVADALLGPGASYVGSDGAVYCCETEWHFDTPDEPAFRHLKFAFYLEPLDQDSGAPRVLPTSHEAGLYDGALKPYLGFDGAIEERTGLRGEDLPCWTLVTQPGDVVAWDYRLMHCAYGTVEPRRKFALNFRAASPLAPSP
jgi:ectoine hydroxylase-related dioxygenase (phytanoyl-CoA dioxygenase family)